MRPLSEAHAQITILYVRSGADTSKLYLDESLVPHGVFSNVFALFDSLATFLFLLS